MDHQTKMAQKRVPPRKSHLLRQSLADFDEKNSVVKVSDRSTILCEAILKGHLEVEIRNLKVGDLVFWNFFVLAMPPPPTKARARQGFSARISYPPPIIGTFQGNTFV